jgi:hypothetical protein
LPEEAWHKGAAYHRQYQAGEQMAHQKKENGV